MRILGILLSMALVVILIGAGSAQEKKATNKEMIVGVWEPTKLPDGVPLHTTWMTIEFKKDGKLWFFTKQTLINKDDGANNWVETYAVDGDKITITRKRDNKDATFSMLITKLTDKELVTNYHRVDGLLPYPIITEWRRK